MKVIKTQTILTGDEETGLVETPDFIGLNIQSFQVIQRLVDGYWLVKVETADEIPEELLIGEVL